MKRSLEQSALSGLTFGRTLMDDPDTNSSFILASAESGAVPVVVILRKTPFREEDVKAIVEAQKMTATSAVIVNACCVSDDRAATRGSRRCNRTTSTRSIVRRRRVVAHQLRRRN